MRIECYTSLQCGSEDALRDAISRALSLEDMKAEVAFYRIDDKAAAERGLRGSPSVFINGLELQPLETTGFS